MRNSPPNLAESLYEALQHCHLKAVSLASAMGVRYDDICRMLRNEDAPMHVISLLSDTFNVVSNGTLPNNHRWMDLRPSALPEFANRPPPPEIDAWTLDTTVMTPDLVTPAMTWQCTELRIESTALMWWVREHQVFTMEALDKALEGFSSHRKLATPRRFGRVLKEKGYNARVEHIPHSRPRDTQRVWRYNPKDIQRKP
jgi:hypothetical protein